MGAAVGSPRDGNGGKLVDSTGGDLGDGFLWVWVPKAGTPFALGNPLLLESRDFGVFVLGDSVAAGIEAMRL